MYKYPDGWREALISDLGLEPSDFLMSVFRYWQESTPLQPYVNNPFGMPYVSGVIPQLQNTGYALFRDMAQFRAAFVAFVKGGHGLALRKALVDATSFPAVYRAIHGLGWPGNATETDYPSGILDQMTEADRRKLQTTSPDQRKTAGMVAYTSAQNGAIGQLGVALGRAASSALSASNALNNYRKR